ARAHRIALVPHGASSRGEIRAAGLRQTAKRPPSPTLAPAPRRPRSSARARGGKRRSARARAALPRRTACGHGFFGNWPGSTRPVTGLTWRAPGFGAMLAVSAPVTAAPELETALALPASPAAIL